MDVFIRVEQRQGEPLFFFVSGIKNQESRIKNQDMAMGRLFIVSKRLS